MCHVTLIDFYFYLFSLCICLFYSMLPCDHEIKLYIVGGDNCLHVHPQPAFVRTLGLCT